MDDIMPLENINKNYIYKADQNGYGRVEYWQVMKPNENSTSFEDYKAMLNE